MQCTSLPIAVVALRIIKNKMCKMFGILSSQAGGRQQRRPFAQFSPYGRVVNCNAIP